MLSLQWKLAAMHGNSDAVDALLKVDPQTADDGYTPLHLAVMHGRLDAVNALLAAAPETATTVDRWGHTPLHPAAFHGRMDVVHALLAAAPQTATVVDAHGQTALHLAAPGGTVDVVHALLAVAPHTATAVDKYNQTPLHLAVAEHRVDVVEALVAVAPETMVVVDVWGNTPLDLAAEAVSDAIQMVALNLLPYTYDTIAAIAEILHAVKALTRGKDPSDWSLVPVPCQGLRTVLAATYARSEASAAHVVRRLSVEDRASVQTACLVLSRVLPTELVGCIASSCVC